MEDAEIIDMYWQRTEAAIEESDKKYGQYCRAIAMRILHSKEDTEECVNDTYVNAWNTIPPQKPKSLKAFLGCITRNLSINRNDYNTAKKRYAATENTIEELWQSVKPNVDIENKILMSDLLNSFLRSLDKQTRIIFVRRYWYFMSINEISDMMGISANRISVTLHRTKKKLKEHFEKAEITVSDNPKQ